MPEREQPNILLVTTDQQRWDTVGHAAPDFMRTPHIDLLQRQGVTFTSAYADCPICVPSRMSIMTGRTVSSIYNSGNGPVRNYESKRYIGGMETLPDRLRDAGYQTRAIGKMHFTPGRHRHGFDEMELPADYFDGRKNAGNHQHRHGLGQNELYPGQATVPERETMTNWIAERCRRFISGRRDPADPFFLWCSFGNPHPPLAPPEPYYSMYRDAPIPDPVCGDWCENPPRAFERSQRYSSFDELSEPVLREARAAYYGLITQVDYNLGRVFGALQEENLMDDTLIVFCSDHGEYLGDHHAGAKGFFHEQSAHVPMVVSLPRSWVERQHGTRVDEPVTLADLCPTFVEAAGGDVSGTDGQDLVALARGELDDPREYVVGLNNSGDECMWLGLTDGVWTYIWYPEGGVDQLFEVSADRLSEHDLSGVPAHAEQRESMRAELRERLERRDPQFVEDGDLIERPVQETAERDDRIGGPGSVHGFVTEHWDGPGPWH